jgi:hypothetical protein
MFIGVGAVVPAAVYAQTPGNVVVGPTKPAASPQVSKLQVELRAAQTQRDGLASRYDGALRAVDSLKKQKAGFRRDRDLRSALATSHDLATQLATVSGQVARLLAQTDTLTTHKVSPVKRIVVPLADVDMLADPEELDAQAAAFKQAEADIAIQVAALTTQEQQSSRAMELQRQHLRSQYVSTRDDDQARGQKSSNPNKVTADEAAPMGNAPPAGTGNTPPTDPAPSTSDTANPTLLSSASTALIDVIDAKQGAALKLAAVSSDPSVRWQAVQNARIAATAKLALLRKQRGAIEARAAALRK